MMSEPNDPGVEESAKYIPALRFHWLTPFYDGVLRLLARENRLRRDIVETISLAPGDRVLDFGCGTATLSIRLKKACPRGDVVGLDIDPGALNIARRKARAAGVKISLQQGDIVVPRDGVGLAADSFDHIVTSLVFHHLTTEQKRGALANAFRLLKPGRKLLLVDWGKPNGIFMRLAFLSVQALDGFETTSDNIEGVLPDLMRQARFEGVTETRRMKTPLGVVAFYSGRKPEEC